MGSYNKAKYLQIADEAEGAMHRMNALSEERTAMMQHRLQARAVITALERAENDHQRWPQPPKEHEIEDARETLERWEELERRYRIAAAEWSRKSQLSEKLTKFLLKKGVKDPAVLEKSTDHRLL